MKGKLAYFLYECVMLLVFRKKFRDVYEILTSGAAFKVFEL